MDWLRINFRLLPRQLTNHHYCVKLECAADMCDSISTPRPGLDGLSQKSKLACNMPMQVGGLLPGGIRVRGLSGASPYSIKFCLHSPFKQSIPAAGTSQAKRTSQNLIYIGTGIRYMELGPAE